MTTYTGNDQDAAATVDRAQLPRLVDRTTIAIESLRTQWRTVAHLGTHERMALSQLRAYGPMPMSELASRISLSRAAVTSIVDRLEQEQWVLRQSDARDRRRTVLQLVPRTGGPSDDLTEAWGADLLRLADELDETELHAVIGFLERLGQLADEHARQLRATAAERSLT